MGVGMAGERVGRGVGVVCQPTIQHIAHCCCANVSFMAFSVKYHFEKKKENNIFFNCFKHLLEVSMAIGLSLYLSMSETLYVHFFRF